MRNIVKGSTALFLSVALVAAWSFAVRAQEGETRTVLALYSQDQGAPFNQAFEAGLRRALQAIPDVRATYYVQSAGLPASSIVVNRESTLWNRYRRYLLMALSIIVAQALLIAAFIVQRVRRIGAETRNKVILRTLPAVFRSRASY